MQKPEIKDKIQRILDRLDQGENLAASYLKLGDKFCVLGLFADESGLGGWSNGDRYIHSFKPKVTLGYILKYRFDYFVRFFDRGTVTLNKQLVDHYGLKDSRGSFDIRKLPIKIRRRILVTGSRYTLVSVNDHMIKQGYKCDVVNETLSDNIWRNIW